MTPALRAAGLSSDTRGILLMSVAMAAFTANDALMKAVTQTLPLMQAIAIRGGLTLAVLLLLALLSGGVRLRLPPKDARLLAWRTLAEVLATLTFLAALMHMPLANLSAILQSLPLAMTLTAVLFLGERVGWRRSVAIVIGFIGVMLVVQPGAAGFDRWSVLGLVSVACVVVRDLTTRRMSAALPTVLVALVSAAAVAAMGALGTTLGSGWQPVAAPEMVRLALASAALILGYLTVVQAMRQGDVARVAPFRYTALLWALVFGWAMFGSLPDMLSWIGAALIVASGLFTLRRARQASRG